MLIHKKSLSEKYRPERVVLLGGSGFLGKKLSDSLKAKGISVLSFSSKELDLSQPESISQLKEKTKPTDAVVFLSAITPDKGKDVAAMMKNIKMAENVAAYLDQSSCSQLVYISSDAVYHDSINPIRESSPCDSGNLYGHMHRTREIILQSIVEKKKIPYAILRPCAVYGSEDTHNSYGPNRFARTAAKDSQITLFGNGEEKRDHVSVDDVVRTIELTLFCQSEGILNIATGKTRSFYEVAEVVAKAVKSKKVQIQCNPRASAITHRHFDPSDFFRTFPDFQFQVFEDQINQWFA